ncbi:MAG: helix-turn-helix transcriptional regulator [Pseudomonadota bacterium]
MAQKISSENLIKSLCLRLDAIRLSQNISQADLALEAGVSRRTLTRLADGQAISLDSFVRVMQALGLTEHLISLLPDPTIRPIDRVRFAGQERQRARTRKRDDKKTEASWVWGDEDPTP